MIVLHTREKMRTTTFDTIHRLTFSMSKSLSCTASCAAVVPSFRTRLGGEQLISTARKLLVDKLQSMVALLSALQLSYCL